MNGCKLDKRYSKGLWLIFKEKSDRTWHKIKFGKGFNAKDSGLNKYAYNKRERSYFTRSLVLFGNRLNIHDFLLHEGTYEWNNSTLTIRTIDDVIDKVVFEFDKELFEAYLINDGYIIDVYKEIGVTNACGSNGTEIGLNNVVPGVEIEYSYKWKGMIRLRIIKEHIKYDYNEELECKVTVNEAVEFDYNISSPLSDGPKGLDVGDNIKDKHPDIRDYYHYRIRSGHRLGKTIAFESYLSHYENLGVYTLEIENDMKLCTIEINPTARCLAGSDAIIELTRLKNGEEIDKLELLYTKNTDDNIYKWFGQWMIWKEDNILNIRHSSCLGEFLVCRLGSEEDGIVI